MADSFELPVIYNGQELLFPATLNIFGYTYKIQVDVFGQLISFEPDEERNFRAVMNMEDLKNNRKIDKALLEEIASAIELIVK